MKILGSIIAWLGFVIMALGVVMSVSTTLTIFRPAVPGYPPSGLDLGHPIAMVLGLIGAVIMIIGGFGDKPRYFWFSSIIIGLIFSLSFIPVIIQSSSVIERGGNREELAMIMLPGLVGVVEGIILKLYKPAKRKAY